MADRREPIPVDPVDVGELSELDNLAHLAAHGGDGRLFKMEQDYSKQVDEALLKARDIAQKDAVAAVESLNNIEKLTRLGADMKSNTRVVQYMTKLCFEGQKWDLLMETIMTLSKKRLLIKMAIAKMVRDAVAMIDKMPTEDLKMKLIETLRTVTAGKIYVEVERARLTSMVVKKLEREGKLDEAATMLLELQVETYGSMEMREKVQYLLEQMRYSLVRNDFVRATIISKKINIKFFNKSDEDEVQNLKLKYYDSMIRIGLHDGNYLDVCRHHREIYETKKIKADSAKATSHLRSAIVYCLLAPHTNEQWDLLNRIAIQRELETVPDYKIILDLFINQELISFKGTIVAKYEKLLRRGTTSSPDTGIFDKSTEGEKRWSDLHLRVGEHNMRMIAKYYTQITFERLAELLDFPVDEMESFVCNLIVTGQITGAKLHRPSRIVNLRLKKANVEQLDVWASNVHKLTDTLNKVSHLILKEQMVHKNLDLAAPRAGGGGSGGGGSGGGGSVSKGEAVIKEFMRFKVHMEGSMNGHEFEIEGEGEGRPYEGTQTAKLKVTKGGPLPFSWDILSPQFMYGSRAFTKHPADIPDYYKQSFPEGFKWERVMNFEDGGAVTVTQDTSLEDGTLIYKVKLRGTNFPPDGPVMQKKTMGWEASTERLYPEDGVLKGDIKMALRLKDGGRYLADFKTTYKAKKPVQMPGAYNVDRKLDITSHNEDYTVVEQYERSEGRHSTGGMDELYK